MATGYEVKMFNDIGVMARALDRIANCLEAAERRARVHEATTPEDIEQMGKAIRAVVRGFAEMEAELAAQAES
jgi:hypothetical protein